MNNKSFDIFKIGPFLAELISVLEKRKYQFKVANYDAIVWDWNEQYPTHIGSIDESCYILTSENVMHPSYAENICISYVFDSPSDEDGILLGFNNYEHPYKNYLNITNGKITFYDDKGNKTIKFPHEDIVYAFIDILIKESENKKLTSSDINLLLNEFIKNNNLEDKYQRLLKKDE